ncbi:hypothetical protein F4782DRAFT_518480 [Xylaria castorea]|nr:hypothetical protein F4782DRAFT_518480 [Xylaria castorea]
MVPWWPKIATAWWSHIATTGRSHMPATHVSAPSTHVPLIIAMPLIIVVIMTTLVLSGTFLLRTFCFWADRSFLQRLFKSQLSQPFEFVAGSRPTIGDGKADLSFLRIATPLSGALERGKELTVNRSQIFIPSHGPTNKGDLRMQPVYGQRI